MSPILGILASSRPAAVGDYESIQTVTVGAGGVANISFTSIPATYKHLQIRIMAQTNRGTYAIDEPQMRLNSDSGTNYLAHLLWGDGASATTNTYLASNSMQLGSGCLGTTTGSNWGTVITDILDYTNTNKYTVTRTLSGTDCNGTVGTLGGRVGLSSGTWLNTAAVSNIYIQPGNSSLFSQYSSFALYGIK